MVAVGLLCGHNNPIVRCHGQRTQAHFIDGILNAQRYHDEILRPIVVQLLCTVFLWLSG